MAFTVITDTSGNLPKFMADEYGLKVIPFYYHVDGKDLCCEAIEDFDSESYYRRLKDGPRVTTTQITPQRYLEYFEEEAKAGRDFYAYWFRTTLTFRACGSAHARRRLSGREGLRDRYEGRCPRRRLRGA